MAINDNYVNVRDYGAWGDGLHDDTIAIQAATRAVADGGILYFPPGTYGPGILPPQLTGQACQKCPNDCKPGEDLCWECLGEDPNNLPYEYDSFTVSSITTNTILTLAPGVSNCTIRDSVLMPNSFSGITISGDNVTITNCTITAPLVLSGDHIMITGCNL